MIQTINTELMLLSWRESSSGGASVTFALPDAEGMELFKALTTAKGGKGGQRFIAAFALLNDDETPAELPQAGARTSARTSGAVAPVHAVQAAEPGSSEPLGPRALLAVQLCSNPAFQEWIRPRYDRFMGGDGSEWGDVHPDSFKGRTAAVRSEAWAKHALLVLCGCERTRRELDSEPECGRRFESEIRRPWVEAMGVWA